MAFEVLEKIGLTKGEAKVYVALLELGLSTAGPITKAAGVSPSKIYSVLERLTKKGLISYIVKGKTRYFRPSDPENLLDFITQEKADLAKNEEKIKELLPLLKRKKGLLKAEQRAEIIEGVPGIKAFFDLSLKELKKGETMYVLGVSKEISRLMHGYFVDFHKRRAKSGITCKSIYNYDSWRYKKREKRALIDYKVFPQGFETPAFIFLFKDYVGTVLLSEEQKICFVIKNEMVAKSYLKYFNLLWAQALKPRKKGGKSGI